MHVCMYVCADGSLIATAGEDGKVKIWNASSGFCFVTFSEHLAPGESRRPDLTHI